jgi:outer membrane protein OmpA-like peptidoglycan-associated protein
VDAPRNQTAFVSIDRTTTLRIRRGRPAGVVELPASLAFEPGGAVLLPRPPVGGVLTALHALGAVLVAATQAPEPHQVLVAGHGPDEALSRRRAESVRAFLRGERDAWAAHAEQHGRVQDWQRLLSWAAAVHGLACDPGGVDGKLGPKTRGALAALRDARGLAGPADRAIASDYAALFDLAQVDLARLLEEGPEPTLATRRAALAGWGDLNAVGCAGHWPPDRVRLLEHEATTAERVDVLVFAPDDAPSLTCHAGPVCDPKACQVFRKGRYRKVELAADSLVPHVQRLHLLEMEDVSFNFDSAVLLPRPRAEEDAAPSQDRITGLAVIKVALQFADLFPEKRLLLAGHTDSAGSVKFNVTLSEERAQNVHAYLRGDRAAWAASCQEHFQVEDWKGILRWIAERFGFDCDPGPVNNTSDEAARAALRRFRARFSQEVRPIPEQGPVTVEDWGAFFDLYERELAVLLAVEPSELQPLRDQVRYLEPPAVGCGEHHPVEDVGDGVKNAANRRVELLFFDEPEEPRLPCHTGGGCDPKKCDLYPRGQHFVIEHLPVDPSALLPPIEVLLHVGDVTGAALTDELLVDDGSGAPPRALPLNQAGATADGHRVFRFFPQDLPDPVTLRWRRDGATLHVAGPCQPAALIRSLRRGEYDDEPGLLDHDDVRTTVHAVVVELDDDLDADADRRARGADGQV